MPGNHFSLPGNHFSLPGNHFSLPGNHFSLPGNRHFTACTSCCGPNGVNPVTLSCRRLVDVQTDSSGANYTLVGVGGTKFLVQPNLDVTTGYCLNTLK